MRGKLARRFALRVAELRQARGAVGLAKSKEMRQARQSSFEMRQARQARSGGRSAAGVAKASSSPRAGRLGRDL